MAKLSQTPLLFCIIDLVHQYRTCGAHDKMTVCDETVLEHAAAGERGEEQIVTWRNMEKKERNKDTHTLIYTHTQMHAYAHCDNGDICSVPVVVRGWLMAHSDGL